MRRLLEGARTSVRKGPRTSVRLVILATLALAACEVDSGDEEPDPFCTIEPTAVTVQTGAVVRFTAECSHRVILDERMDANGAYITRVDFIDWTAPLVPGDVEAVVYPEGFPSVTAAAQVTVLEDPIELPNPTIWRARRGHWQPSFNPGGTLIGSLTFDAGSIAIWDSETLQFVESSDQIGVGAFSWHPDNPTGLLISGGSRDNFGFRALADFDWAQEHVTRWYTHSGFSGLAYSPDGNYVAGWSDGAIWIDRVATDGFTAFLQLLDVVPQIWTWAGAVGLPELDDNEILTLPISSPVENAYFTEDSSELVVAFGNQQQTVAFTFFDVETGLESRTVIPGGADCGIPDAWDCPIAYFIPHPDGERMIGYGQWRARGESQAVPARVFVASMSDGALEYVPDVGIIPGRVEGLLASPDGRYVATQTLTVDSGSLYGDNYHDGIHLALFDLQRLEWTWTLFSHDFETSRPVVLPSLVAWNDPDRILVNTTESPIDDQGVLQYLDPEDGSVIQTQVLPQGPHERTRWSPDGERAYWFGDPAANNVRSERGYPSLIVYDADGQVLWGDVFSGADWVTSDPDTVVTTGDDGLSWRNAETGEIERTTPLSVGVESIALSDDQSLLIGWNNGAGGHILQDVETGERLNDMITGAVLTPPYDWTPEGLIVDSLGNAWNPETRENSQLGAPWGTPTVDDSDMIDWCFDDCGSGDQICSRRCEASFIPTCFSYSPSGNRLAIGEGALGDAQYRPDVPVLSQIRVIDVRTGVERGVFPIRTGIREGCSLDWHPTRDELLIGSWDIIWNLDITTELE